ncbi:hypothetical protein ABH935_007026 [Catenulispora sp. GAS73]|uniref:hypothetical protein n=1 Tax=Catenulispora sp. GAS73 TaxID=3156269 RepID=UPI003518D869
MTSERNPLVYKSMTVAYVTSWDSEAPEDTTCPNLVLRQHVAGGAWLRYTDEAPEVDRQYGVLWTRVPWSPGIGKPQFKQLHALRSRRVMARGQCQICRADASGGNGVWMTPATVFAEYLATRPAGTPFEASDPPLCRSCVPIAAAQCAHMATTGYVFLAPRTWQITAVRGAVANPHTLEFTDDQVVPLTSPDPFRAADLLRRTLAKALVAELRDFQVYTDPDACPGLGQRLDPVKPPAPLSIPLPRSGD